MKKYEIPFNFDLELLNFLDENIDKNWVEFLFMAPYKEDSINARSHAEGIHKLSHTYKVPQTREEYKYYVKEIQKRGYPLAILFQEQTPIAKEKLDFYLKLGIDIFVVNSDELAILLKNINPKFKVIASITKTLSAKELWENDYSMYDKIVLHFPFNRALDRIKTLPNKYKYSLLVNSFCAYNCINAKAHWYSTKETVKNIKCIKEQNKDDLIFIPPEYIHIFEPYVDSFKIQGREYSTYIISDEINCYYNKLHNPRAGIIYNRLNEENALDYFNKGKDYIFTMYRPKNNSPTSPNNNPNNCGKPA